MWIEYERSKHVCGDEGCVEPELEGVEVFCGFVLFDVDSSQKFPVQPILQLAMLGLMPVVGY